ncbi:hypothetical protein N665_0005s0033 [Sinapis alba]|nr:hypothetical protein N665_0005s0033 [Sinapis alba]
MEAKQPQPQKRKGGGGGGAMKNPPPISLSSLPGDILLNCFSRISRSHYRSLSLLSKNIHSLISSPHLYSLRSQRGNIEPCLYLCQSSPAYDNWHSLDQTLSNSVCLGDESSLSPIPPSSSTPPKSPTTVAVGFEIYQLGGTINKQPSSAVRVLDCRNHTWRDAPDMTVARRLAEAAFIDGKIIVTGGTEDRMKWVEIFDLKTQTWTPLPSPNNAKATLYGGKLYVRSKNTRYVYVPKEGTWKVISQEVHGFGLERKIGPWCVIEDVMFSFDLRKLMWYDSEKIIWKRVLGLEELFRNPLILYSTVRLVNYCGKLIILWGEPRSLEFPMAMRTRIFRCKRMWYAVIRLEKSLSGLDILGKIERSNALVTVSNSYKVFCCVTL